MEDYILNNDVAMPKVGLGVYKMKSEHEDALVWALNHGYRHIDTAAFYHNEELIASAIRKSGVKRKDLFITTKVWSSDVGKKTNQAFEKSLQKLQTDYIDLYLIHWPVRGYLESWRTMETLYKEGKIRAIGVANFEQNQLEEIMKQRTIKPAVNQIQTNPYLQQHALHEYLVQHQIQHIAWGSLGQGSSQLFQDQLLSELADKYGKTTAQIMLRWSIQLGIAVIPKSVHPDRLQQNLEVFDFQIADGDMNRISTLERNKRGINDPNNKLFLWFLRFIR
ncbi:aldo/keto reductase [Paenibacillus sp. FSL H7-0918]|uniref:aldo/keto reductase n=1 Tax=Paenibacillus sp. FSL H7-0918 TaxID=2921442 RepID=UPI0030FC509D